jgi:parallel beta-helix repeat protein
MAILIIPIIILTLPMGENSPVYSASAAQPPALEDTTTFWNGDWVVDSNTVYQNQTIIVNGNLTVLGGFSLSLINVTLKMNNTGNMTTYIHVNNGATFIISDYDSDPSTIQDGCEITSNISDSQPRYGFYVHQNSVFTMENSMVSEVGHGMGSIEERGLYIHTNNAIVRNCTVSRGYRGIIVEDSLNTIIENCQLLDLDDDGIFVQSTSDSLFYQNYIEQTASGDFGIMLTGACSKNILSGNIINVTAGNSQGIRVQGGGVWNEIIGNTINVTGSGSEGILLFSGYVNITSNIVNLWNPASAAIQLSGGSFTRIMGNTVFASGYNAEGLDLAFVDNVTVIDNDITVEQDNCLGIRIWLGAHDILIENATVTVTSGINNWGCYFDNVYDITIINSSITGAQTDMDLNSDSHVMALNTSFSSFDISDSQSDLTVQHFLDLTVEDWTGSPQTGALVSIVPGLLSI